MEHGLGELHCTLPVVDLTIPHRLAAAQALRILRLHRATAAILNTDISLQNFMSGW